MMKTDIQIAQEAEMLPIKEVAANIGLCEDDLELYGKYKAKISDEYWNRIKDNPDGKLVLVTAINPTPAGEGKTTVTVGLGEALGQLGKKSIIALREPSLGPCFGIKGGAAGGGYAQVVPMEDLNLHFTGDFHAITAANNLLAALLDNQDTPVIMLTANAITGIREQFLQAGFTDYLSKPVSGDKLESMILKYLPPEKCLVESAFDDMEEDAKHPDALKKLLKLYPKVDLTKGLTVCGDSYDLYMDILQTYAESPETDKLNTYLEQRKAYDYQVCAHSIKSSSLSVGFSELAEQALAMENAAREGDWDFICANHASFIEAYRLAIDAIQKAFHA